MGNVMTYSGLTTKVRAMQAKLLNGRDFENIANLRSVPEAIEYLKDKPAYVRYMEQIDVSLYHRGNIEKFLKLYWKRYEIDLINYCLRIVFNHYDMPFDIEYKKVFFDKYSQISIDKLITSRNVEELIDNLKDTEYYAPLQPIRESEGATLFDYDLALDLYYFSEMWRKSRQLLKGKEREMYIRDFGSRIDLLNIQWIYRAKKYYNMLPPDIYSLTIPIQYRLSVDEFKGLVEAPTVEEYEKRLEETYYAEKYADISGKTLEATYKECLERQCISDRRRNPYSIATVNTYLFLKEEEIYKLTTALECIRYGLSSRETLGYLGGVMQ